VSFKVDRGETLALVGESGSGKSMLALSIMRVLPPKARVSLGTVLLNGTDLTSASEHEMREIRGHRVAMVPQDPMTAFDPLLTVGDQIIESIQAHDSRAPQAARERMLLLLEQVRLPDPHRVAKALTSQLSGGMNQRALIAMALATSPYVLLADEPTTALDVTVQAQVLELLKDLQRQRGLAVLLITHDMGVAAMAADRIAVMYAGRIVEEGRTGAIFQQARHPYTVGLMQAASAGRSSDGRHASIPGSPPNLLSLPPGCAFAPRCLYARPPCETGVPALRSFQEVRAACVLEDLERPWLREGIARMQAHG
jgi:oligopeptide/dipeptide ABC transporter ATP-binding protein